MSGFSTARQKMVDGQVRPSDVTDIQIIDAMLAVPREAFVPETRRAVAYLDLDLDVQRGRRGAAIPDPARGAGENAAGGRDQGDRPGSGGRLRQRLRRRGDRAIGAGQVMATESDAALAAKAQDILSVNGCGNVAVRTGAAAEGYPANAPFDVIVINGASRDRAGAALRPAPGRRPAGRGVLRPRRPHGLPSWRAPMAISGTGLCSTPPRAGPAGAGTASGVRFLAILGPKGAVKIPF